MIKITKENNITRYYLGDELLLTIATLENNLYIIENKYTRLKGFCKNIDEYTTEIKLDENYFKGKNGRWYKTKKLFNHNQKWFAYMLQEKGFVFKTKPILA